jgi:Leucine-rich repeat (LRR) protein
LASLDVSNNRLRAFPGPAMYADGTDTGTDPRGAARFVPLGLVAAHLYGLTHLNLSRNGLQELDPRLFGSPRSPPRLASIDVRCRASDRKLEGE